MDTSGNDSTGARGKPSKPFLTIDAAIAAATAGDTIYIAPGTYASPTTEKAGLTYIGAGRPRFNSLTAPTALQYGTILQGHWAMSLGGQSVSHLGIDVGSAFCTANFSGVAQEGLWFYQSSPSSRPYGFQCRDVIVLGKDASNCHAFLAENVTNVLFENCWSYYNTHGIACKGADVNIHGHRGWGHGTGSLTVRAETGQVVEAVRASDLFYQSSGVDGVNADGGAVIIQNDGGTIKDIWLDGVLVDRCSVGGVMVRGNYDVRSVKIKNLTAIGPMGAGVSTAQSNGILSSLIIDGCYLLGVLSTAGFVIGNGVTNTVPSCIISNVYCRAASSWATLLYCGNVNLDNCNFGTDSGYVYIHPTDCVCYSPPGGMVGLLYPSGGKLKQNAGDITADNVAITGYASATQGYYVGSYNSSLVGNTLTLYGAGHLIGDSSTAAWTLDRGLAISTAAAGVEGLVVKGFTSQSANLLTCKNVGGDELVSVSSGGNLTVNANFIIGSGGVADLSLGTIRTPAVGSASDMMTCVDRIAVYDHDGVLRGYLPIMDN